MFEYNLVMYKGYNEYEVTLCTPEYVDIMEAEFLAEEMLLEMDGKISIVS